MTEKVVFLKFRTDNADTETHEVLSCKHCRNKMFSVVYDENQDYPTLRCGCCGNDIGRIGWADAACEEGD